MDNNGVANATTGLEEENRRLKETIEKLTERNQQLQDEVARLTISTHGLNEKQSFRNALCLLEDVYGDLVALTKKEIVQSLQTETDESSRVLLEKHEKIKEEVTAIRQQSIALQQRLKVATTGQDHSTKLPTEKLDEPQSPRPKHNFTIQTQSSTKLRFFAEVFGYVEIGSCTGRKDPLRPTLSNLSTVGKCVPSIEYYVMRGDCRLTDSFRNGPETPDFLKSETRRSVFDPRRKSPVSGGPLTPQRVISRRPSSSIVEGIQGQRKLPTKFRPLTSTQIHREFLQRKLNPSVQKPPPRKLLNGMEFHRPEMKDYIVKN